MQSLSELLMQKNIKSLRSYTIAENRIIQSPNVIGYAFEDGVWIVYEVDERCQKRIFGKLDSEEDAIKAAFRVIKAFHNTGR